MSLGFDMASATFFDGLAWLNPKVRRDLVRGSLLGTMIGDCYGRTRELRGHNKGKLIGSYTDDTQMTMALAECLINEGWDATADQMIGYFAEHYDRSRCYGGFTDKILHDIKGGMPWHLAVAKNKPAGGSWGNGCAMRAAPIAFASFDYCAQGIMAMTNCVATGHTHHDAYVYSANFVKAVNMAFSRRYFWYERHEHARILIGKGLMKGDPNDISYFPTPAVDLRLPTPDKPHSQAKPDTTLWRSYHDDLLGYYETRCYKEDSMDRVLNSELLYGSADDVAREIGCGYNVKQAVSCAIWAWLVAGKDGPMAVLDLAADIGGDMDTICAMAGALAGAYYGESAWPKEVTDELENGAFGKDFLLSLADDLAKTPKYAMTEDGKERMYLEEHPRWRKNPRSMEDLGW
ncbi:hypothetical protein FJZ55_09025 [Candidatus Woesearchaeota archaeon]|nr:hypothetical protein [Candidatus Woesearchaeota archaeon]